MDGAAGHVFATTTPSKIKRRLPPAPSYWLTIECQAPFVRAPTTIGLTYAKFMDKNGPSTHVH